MVDLLINRIPAAHRRGNVGETYLRKWVKASNTQRTFMYLSKAKMILLAARLTGMRMGSTLSFDVMVDKLAEAVVSAAGDQAGAEAGNPPPANNGGATTQEVTIRQEIIQAMLKRSFMKRLVGDEKDYCEMGHKLELPLGINWMKDVNKKNLFPGFSILSLHKVGLVSKKNSPWVKDSIDFVAAVKDENAAIQLWGVEIKSRQKQQTCAPEKELQRQLRRKKYEVIASDQASKYIRNPGDRYQVLHHAYTYGFEKVALIIGDSSGKVINGTIIEYANEIHNNYREVLDELKNIALSWAYSDGDPSLITIPDEVLSISEQVPTINGEETLYGQLKLWKVMFDDPAVLPMPVITRILPCAHAEWNATKGGSDTVTKINDECVLKPPRCYVNLNSMATSRCITNLLVSLFKLYQLTTAKKDITFYPSLKHFRNAASSRSSFKTFLRMVYGVCKKEVRGAPQLIEEDAEQTEQGRALRSTRINGIIPEKMTFAVKPTFKTPKRGKRQQIEGGKANHHIIERTTECTGFPYEVVSQTTDSTSSKDIRHKCYICGTKTKWQCLRCRFYFCMGGRSETQNRTDQLYTTSEKENQGSTSENITKVYRKSCYHVAHEAAIKKSLHEYHNTTN